jgi:hypothetical protein
VDAWAKAHRLQRTSGRSTSEGTSNSMHALSAPGSAPVTRVPRPPSASRAVIRGGAAWPRE